MDAAALAHRLGAVRSGRQWKCKCVAHEDGSPSMIIFDGITAPQVRCLAGCEPSDIIAALRQRGLWERDPLTSSDGDKRQQPEKVSHETVMRERARRVFFDAVLTVGTPAQRYLEAREIWTVARGIEDIRFHPACPREKLVQPALVIAMRSIVTHTIQAVQRIFLTREARKDGAMMLGPQANVAMQLAPICRILHVCEGLETALSVMAMDYGPVWALGSCGAIERFQVIDGVDELVIWADNDAPGIKAANVCSQRWWDSARRLVRIRTPKIEGQDFADVWRARCARP